MLYALGLFVHSWLRWGLLGLAIGIGLRAALGWRRDRPWSLADARMLAALGVLVRLQVVIGLVLLLWLSPLPRAAWHAGIGGMLDAPALLVFAIVHPAGMILGTAVLAHGHARAQRTAEPRAKHRIIALAIGGWLAIVIAAIPWPGLPWGRPLARLGGPALRVPPAVEAPAVYGARCAACHGANGDGRGPAASSFDPRPRAFDDPTWQATTSDARLRRAIRDGGAALGMSAAMPPHPDLTPDDITALIAFIRASATKAP